MRQIPAQWRTATMVVTLALALASAGCAPGASTPKASGGQSTTPTATLTPKTLYQADWSARQSEWSAPHWQVRNGALVNDGGGTDPIAIPYHPTVENYTIEVVMTVEEIRGASACANSYGMEGLTDSGKAVYFATVACVDKQRHGFSYLYAANADDSSGTHTYDYTTGSSPHTYDVIVEGRYVTFNLNGSSLGTIDLGAQAHASNLLLLDSNMGLSVQSVTITTP